ncbi:mechanosensitive ion channel family protein [Haloparvum sp. PAK95]|uniref:mechanosensitive ion channel family protein n=1 Tax=Haloparvum sp. PAK95 TaxID=3418962 RepID=UPI003D2EA550
MTLAFVQVTREFLGSFTTTEARLVATTVLLLAALAVARQLIPWLTRRGVAAVRNRATGRTAEAIDAFSESFPWRTPITVLIRGLQLVVYALVGLSLFLVWGRWSLAMGLFARVSSLVPHLGRLAVTFLLFFGAYVGAEVLRDLIHEMTRETERVSPHHEQIIFRMVQLSLFTLVGFSVLTLWQVDLSGLFVGAGFLGIVVGLAARQTIGSLVAGVVLMFSRPFEIGDWVEIGDQEGIVTEISIITTRLRSFDGVDVAIPNDKVGDSVVRNLSQEGQLRLRLEVGVDYQTDPQRAAELALETIEDVDAIVNNPAPNVVPTTFGDSAVVLEMRFWIDRPTPQHKWRAIRGAIYEVKSAFEAEGIKIPFPQRELSGRAETGGFRVVETGVEEPAGEARSDPAGDSDT